MIAIRLVLHKDALSAGIILKTGGEYAHAEALTADGTVIGAFAEGGVQERPIDYDHGNFVRETFALLPADAEMTAKFYHWVRAVIGEPYGFADIAGFTVGLGGLDLHHQHRVICSALMVNALRGCSFFPHPLPIPAHAVTPVMLQQMLLCRPEVRLVTRAEAIAGVAS
jgi:hypothetical protein